MLARLASCLGEVVGELDLGDPGDEGLAGKNTVATIRQRLLKEVREIGRDVVGGGGVASPLRRSGVRRELGLDLGLDLGLGNLRGSLLDLGNLRGSLLDLGNLRSLDKPDSRHARLNLLSEHTILLVLSLDLLGQILDPGGGGLVWGHAVGVELLEPGIVREVLEFFLQIRDLCVTSRELVFYCRADGTKDLVHHVRGNLLGH